MKKLIIITILAMLVVTISGCYSDDPFTDEIYLQDLYSDNVIADNVTTNYLYSDYIVTDNLTATDIASDNISSDQIYLGGAQLLIPAYGEIYASGAAVLELAIADTPYLYDGVTDAGEMNGFSNNGFGKLTYTDITANRVCLINTALTCSVDAADIPAIIRCYIYKNGVVDPASLVGDYFVTGDVVEALPIVCLIELLKENDYIELYFESNVNDATVTIATMTLIATTVD